LRKWYDGRVSPKASVPVFLRKVKAGLFRLSPRHYSNHRWYGHYKEQELKRILEQPFTPNLSRGHGRWLDERVVEYPWMLSRLPKGPACLLDAGSTLNHRFILDQPQLREKNITVMTLAPEKNCFWRERVSYVFGDLRNTYFRDETFDAVVCLSVLEHIGLDNTRYTSSIDPEKQSDGYLAAIAQFRRVLKGGGVCLVSVPYGKHQRRPWLQVFNSTMILKIVEGFAPSTVEIAYFMYSERDGWQSSSADEASGAAYFDLNSDAPWRGCPAGAEAVACLELRK
jgi:SAM-dependent methyltransferase